MHEKMLSLPALISWLESYMGVGLGCEMPPELLMDQIMLELSVIGRFIGGGDTDRGGVREPVCQPDEEEEALRTAERLVYGWPSRDEDPTGAHSRGRFVKAFPLDFPMGIADLI